VVGGRCSICEIWQIWARACMPHAIFMLDLGQGLHAAAACKIDP
jgi:hypothetical protein